MFWQFIYFIWLLPFIYGGGPRDSATRQKWLRWLSAGLRCLFTRWGRGRCGRNRHAFELKFLQLGAEARDCSIEPWGTQTLQPKNCLLPFHDSCKYRWDEPSCMNTMHRSKWKWRHRGEKKGSCVQRLKNLQVTTGIEELLHERIQDLIKTNK